MRACNFTVTILFLSLCLAGPGNAGEAKPLLDTGSFPASALVSEADRFLRLQVAEPGKMVSLYAEAPVAGVKALQLSFRVRYANVRRGTKAWFDARIMLDFHDAKGAVVKPGPPPPNFTGTSDGWRAESLRFAVPEGAVILTVMPALFQAESGTFDLANLVLTAIDSAALPPVALDAHGAAQVQVDAGGKPPAALHVDGPKVVDAAGAEAWLQGVNVPSLEWSNTGDALLPSVVTAIAVWKANIIRLPVLGSRWLGKQAEQSDGGTAYRALVGQVVQAAATRGAYVIIDLHQFRAPKDEDVEFWTSAATAYKDNPAVLFGLFNEPHGLSWEVWQNGGQLDEKAKKGDALTENKEAMTSFHSPGIQALLTAARATGARNIAVVGGLDWAYDLSGILDGHALDDHGGNGIIYDAHVYPWKSDWQHRFLAVAEQHPVLLGEVGCDSKRYDFVPPERFENPYTWAPDILACIQHKHLHWTAWSFHPKASPAVIEDQALFTPTPYWGSFVRAALLGAKFQSEKLR